MTRIGLLVALAACQLVLASDEIPYRIRWSRIADYPVRLSEVAAIAARGRIYVMGGKITHDNQDLADNRDVNFTYEYDPGGSKWTRRAGMLTARYDVALAELEGRIYAISTTNESYDPATDAWLRHAPLPNGGAHLKAATVNGRIFVFSGESPGLAARNLAFAPKTDAWRERAPIPTPRLFHNVVALSGKVYVMGGIGYDASGRLGPTLHEVEVYDAATDRWESRRAMPDGVFRAEGAGVVDGKVFLVGVFKGERLDEIRATAEVYVYDPEEDRWGRATPLPHSRGGMGVAFLDGRIYAVGGHDEGFVQSNEAYAGTVERTGAVLSPYEQERARFQSKLTSMGPAPEFRSLPAAPPGLQTITYTSGGMKLRAWLSVPKAARTAPRPAVVFFHGGFELGPGYVEMARPFIDAGYVVLFPTLRGENGNPGHFEFLLGEIDDAAAAVRWIASQPYVDRARVYTYGQSVGGRVSLMLSLRTDVPIRMGGGSGGLYTADSLKRRAGLTPFDLNDESERRIRAPFDYLKGMPHRHVAFAGRQDYPVEDIALFKKLAAGTKLEVRDIEGDHMGCVRPAVMEFLRIIAEPSAATLKFREGKPVGSSWSMQVALADLDGDRDLDLFEVNYGGPSRVWLSDGTGAFTDSGQALGRSASHAVALGDLDGDGDLDAFVTNVEDQSNTVWMNCSKGRFTHSDQQFERNSTMCVALGDVDGDGDLDAVVGRFGAGAAVYLNDGKGRFALAGPQLGAVTTAGCALGDVDGDGDLDIVAGGWSEKPGEAANAVWINDGKARFTRGLVLEEPGRRVHAGVAVGDLDGDGRPDIVLGFGGGDRLFSVWLNAGHGRFRRAGDMAGNGSVHGLALGDLDRDGDLDLVLAQNESNTAWLNNGHGEFRDSGVRLGNALSAWVAIGDVDGDNAPDLVFADSDPKVPGRAAPNAMWKQR